MAFLRAIDLEFKRIVAGITEALRRGRDVCCRLGMFRLYETRAYTGLNPRTGEPVPVPAKRWPWFQPSRALIEASFGGERVPVPAPRYELIPLQPGEVLLYNLAATDPHGDFGGEDPWLQGFIATETEDVQVDEALLHDIGDALRRGKSFGISGIGKFVTRRLPRRRLSAEDDRHAVDADLAGKWTVALRVSLVLKDAIQP